MYRLVKNAPLFFSRFSDKLYCPGPGINYLLSCYRLAFVNLNLYHKLHHCGQLRMRLVFFNRTRRIICRSWLVNCIVSAICSSLWHDIRTRAALFLEVVNRILPDSGYWIKFQWHFFTFCKGLARRYLLLMFNVVFVRTRAEWVVIWWRSFLFWELDTQMALWGLFLYLVWSYGWRVFFDIKSKPISLWNGDLNGWANLCWLVLVRAWNLSFALDLVFFQEELLLFSEWKLRTGVVRVVFLWFVLIGTGRRGPGIALWKMAFCFWESTNLWKWYLAPLDTRKAPMYGEASLRENDLLRCSILIILL